MMLPRLFLASLLFILVGCSGWHLRGSETTFNTTNLDNAVFLKGQTSATYDATRKLLNAQNWLATDDRNYSLELGKESFSSRTASLNADGLAAETELKIAVPYIIQQLQSDGQRITLATTVAEVSRSYTADNDDIGAKAKEENELRSDMRNAAARAIIRRLSLLSAQ